jgi:hypothetical protein
MKRFILGYFSLKKSYRKLKHFCHKIGSELITQLVLTASEIDYLGQAFYRSLNVKSNRVKPHTTILDRHRQTESERLVQTAQGLELNFFLETTRFLE